MNNGVGRRNRPMGQQNVKRGGPPSLPPRRDDKEQPPLAPQPTKTQASKALISELIEKTANARGMTVPQVEEVIKEIEKNGFNISKNGNLFASLGKLGETSGAIKELARVEKIAPSPNSGDPKKADISQFLRVVNVSSPAQALKKCSAVGRIGIRNVDVNALIKKGNKDQISEIMTELQKSANILTNEISQGELPFDSYPKSELFCDIYKEISTKEDSTKKITENIIMTALRRLSTNSFFSKFSKT